MPHGRAEGTESKQLLEERAEGVLEEVTNQDYLYQLHTPGTLAQNRSVHPTSNILFHSIKHEQCQV